MHCIQKFPANAKTYLLIFSYLVLVWLPEILSLLFKLKFNLSLKLFYEIFILLSLVVGAAWEVYKVGISFDKLMHFVSGILFAIICYNFYEQGEANHLGLFWIFVLVMGFSITFGAIWEVVEFSFDGIMGENTQRWQNFVGREVLFDTMIDVICDIVGAIFGAIYVVILAKRKVKSNA